MEGENNYEKKVDAYRDGLLPDEINILDSINAELKKNILSETGKTDTNLLNIKDNFDLYGQEWKALFSKDIQTFWDKEVWEKFHKFRYDIEKRGMTPAIVSDRESKDKKLSLDDILNADYTGIDSMLYSSDENQRRFCLNFIKDISKYRWLSANTRNDLMKKINDALIEKISTNTWLVKEIEWAMSYLYTTSNRSQEVINLNYSYFIKLFQWLPKDISKETIWISWLDSLVSDSNELQEPNNINNLLKIVEEKLDPNYLIGIYANLLNFDIHNVSIETTISNLDSMIINAFPSNIQSLAGTESLFYYMIKNNQIDRFEQTLSRFSLSKKTIFIYAFLFAAEYNKDEEMLSYANQLIGWNKDVRDVFKVLVSWIWFEQAWDTNVAMYNKYFWADGTVRLDANDVKQNVINKVAGQADLYAYQVLRYSWVERDGLNIKTMLQNSTNIIQDIQILESKSLSISDIDWLNEIIQKQQTEEMKHNVWFECIMNSPNELIGKLLNSDTNKIFWFDKTLFDILYANSPDRQDKQKLKNDLIKLSELIKETGNLNSTRDLFDTYNLTNYRRYSKRLLNHMIVNKETPTGKPIFPVFMTKRDHNGALGSVLNDNWELEKMMTEFDIRAFEPGDDTEWFFGSSGILDKFYTEYIARWWKRENVNSMIGMHWGQSSMHKSKSLNPSEYITLQDKDLFTQLSKYLKWWTLSLLSCSTWSNSNWENNVAQSAAKSVHCRIMAPHNDTNLENIIYNKSWWVEFTNYAFNTSTVIYDGREILESKEDLLEIDKDMVDNLNILENDGWWAIDFTLQNWTFGDVVISQTETENRRKITKWNDIVFLEKRQNNWKYQLSIDTTWSESSQFEIPYTAFSKWLPKTIVDREWNKSIYENNFRVESDSKLQVNIIKSISWLEKEETDQEKIYIANKNIVVDLQDYTTIKSIDIYDMSWKIIQNTDTIDQNKIELDMNWKSNWVYIVRILKNNGTYSSKKILMK